MNTPHVDVFQAVEQTGNPNFTGTVSLQRLLTPPESGEIEVLAVFFAAGSRTRPHIHERDQVLYILEGDGIVAIEGNRLLVSAGDVASIAGGVWHWHGASPDASLAHLSIKRVGGSQWDVDERDYWAGYEQFKPSP